MQKLISLISLILMFANPAFAGSDDSLADTILTSSVISVDGNDIVMPSPAGFVAASEKMPGLKTVFSKYFPDTTILYESYVTEENIEQLRNGSKQVLDNYFVVTQPGEMRNQDFTKKSFAEIAAFLKKDGDTLFDNGVGRKIDERIKKGNETLSEITNEKVDIQLDKLGFLGIFETSENAVLFSIRAEVNDAQSGQKETVIASSAFLLLGNKVIILAAYASEQDAKSKVSGLAWTQTEIAKWTKAILAANPDSTKANR